MVNRYDNPIPVVVAVVTKPSMMGVETYIKNKKPTDPSVETHTQKVQKGIQYLMIKRDVEPQRDKWALPSGYVNSKECPKEAVLRELKEETGLEGKVSKLLRVENPMPGELNQILIYYKVLVEDFSNLQANSEASDVRFKTFSWMPSKRSFRDLAFPSNINLITDELKEHYSSILKEIHDSSSYGSYSWDIITGRTSY